MTDALEDAWDVHWDEFGEANKRNPAQDYRRDLALVLLSRREDPRRLLDIGSGNGAFLRSAGSRWPTAELLGLELSAAGVAAAQAAVPHARFRVRDVVSEPVPDPPDDHWATHAACSEVLEHVDDPVALLRNARAWMAPGCRLVVTVPGGPMSDFDHHIGHRRHFSPEQLRTVMEEAGLEVRLVTGAGFPFFNLYRALVIARGARLIEDARSGTRPLGALIGKATMMVFRPLFALNLPRSPLGWQTIGVAVEPGGASA